MSAPLGPAAGNREVQLARKRVSTKMAPGPFGSPERVPGRLTRVASSLTGPWATLADNFLYQPATERRYAWRFGNGLPGS